MQAVTRERSPALLGRRGKAQAQFRHGAALHARGMLAQAAAAFESATQLDPDHIEAHRMRATTLAGMGRHADALGLLGRAAQRHPGEPALLSTMGRLLLAMKRPREAAGALLLAVAARPDDAQVLSALGIAFLQCDDLPQARAHTEAAFRLAPDFENAVNHSRVLLEAGAFDEAEAVSALAVQLRGDSLTAWNNHALALEGLRRHADAEAAWRTALDLAPDNADSCHKLATLLLTLGRLTPETWALYERRLDGRVATGTLRRWHGEDITGKTLLLHAEQGLGDTIQFVRYAPMAAARGARVILAVQPGLMRLLAGLPGVDQMVAVGGALPAFDVFCPLLSLPAVFQTTLDAVPPPLRFDVLIPQRAPGGLRVGLVWAGNPGFVNDRSRSLPPGSLAPLTQLAGVQCHSLQFGEAIPPGLCIADAMDGVADFADTARRVAGLDLVIAVDTAVAHLAATMGKPVWLLSRFLGCWRWLFDRADSPWYPTMRVYRQPQPNDWASVIQRVEHDLRVLAQENAAA